MATVGHECRADSGRFTVADVRATDGRDPEGVPPGRWAPPPGRTMSVASLSYERWVRLRTGGPADLEYAVTHPQDKTVWFDAVDTTRGVLIEAKGHYGCFVDPVREDWVPWYRWSARSGLTALLGQARRQVEAATGCPVRWWCAEELVAELLSDEFRASPRLSGRVSATFEAMPGWSP